ncbi:hypothetical protein [Tolypothrix sp. NIES-4075]|uniref:hypothetical protein n=1 Tax=Tolypothrix sp. NIES-4075 TaxID=2005459 RepID=UPI00135A5CEC|nr:hypothetical protein [Tolypothrix sp. NIES-4075]
MEVDWSSRTSRILIYWLDCTSSKTWVTSLGCFSDRLHHHLDAQLTPRSRFAQ